MKKIIVLFLLTAVLTLPASAREVIYVAEINDVIVPVMENYVREAIKEAQNADAQAVIFIIDTPGGLVKTMEGIVKEFLNAEIPVISFVYPSGAQASSAGAFITVAADIAAMAPQTNIGSASPVALGGKMDETSELKAKTSLQSRMATIAQGKKRNAEVLESFVSDAANLTESQAKEKNAVDIVALDINDLIDQLHNMQIEKHGINYLLNVKDAQVINFKPGVIKKFLIAISNPQIVYILMILGIYGIIYEFASPGFGFAGALGAIFLIISFFALAGLPVTTAGIMLLLLGIAFIILEVFISGYGIVAGLGIVSFVVGSFMLFDSPFFKVPLSLIAATVVFSVLFIVFAVGSVIKAQKRKVHVGMESVINNTADVRQALIPKGIVFYDGELWTAETVDGSAVKKGEKVKIIKNEGIKLMVEKIS